MSDGAPDIAPELIRRARSDDEDALEALVREAYPPVRRWALVHTGDEADADDLTQDVLIRMIRRIHTYKGDASFGTWLYAITRNTAVDRFRRDRRRSAVSSDPRVAREIAPGVPADPAAGVEREELRALLEAFFSELPTRQREVFDLVELQGVSAASAAELLGIEPVSVRAHLFKARRRMRAAILAERPEVAEDLR